LDVGEGAVIRHSSSSFNKAAQASRASRTEEDSAFTAARQGAISSRLLLSAHTTR
jgi:hypothetical protein